MRAARFRRGRHARARSVFRPSTCPSTSRLARDRRGARRVRARSPRRPARRTSIVTTKSAPVAASRGVFTIARRERSRDPIERAHVDVRTHEPRCHARSHRTKPDESNPNVTLHRRGIITLALRRAKAELSRSRLASAPMPFKLTTQFSPKGDQPQAIEELDRRARARRASTRSCSASPARGKTFTVANVIEQSRQADADHRAQQDARRAALRRDAGSSSPRTPSSTSSATTTTTSPRRTSRRPTRSSRRTRSSTTQIDRMRHAATHALLSRRDVIIVASVSLHLRHRQRPRATTGSLIELDKRRGGPRATRCCAGSSTSSTSATTSTSTAARSACAATSSRSSRPTSTRRRSASSSSATRSRRSTRSIRCAASVKGKLERVRDLPRLALRHAAGSRCAAPSSAIREELRERLDFFDKEGRFLEKQRLEQRTLYDLEMMEQMGFCNGIENYSRHLSGRKPGEPPPTLIDYFPKDFLLVVDESHQTVPQVGGDVPRRPRAQGDARRVRLPPAERARQPPAQVRRVRGARAPGCIYVSATPGEYELDEGARASSSSRSSARRA